MGVVYHARDLKLRRDVALKRPRSHLCRDPAQRKRFLREARAASRLAHPNIVPVYEVFECDDKPWLAMALIDETLQERLKRAAGPLPVRDVLGIAIDLADGLHAAHEGGVLHRDLKPANVMITSDGRAMITDFGLARLVAPDLSTLSAEDGVAGTPAYMSPEQVLGEPIDERSDLFALGVVIYEMSSGKRPFGGVAGAVFDGIVHGDPPRLSGTNSELPQELEQIVGRAMAKRREDRYASAAELHADLSELVRQLDFEEYVESHRDSPVSIIARRRRLRRRSAVGTAVVLSLFGVAMFIWAMSQPRDWPAGDPLMRALVTWPGNETGSRISPDGEHVSFLSDRSDGIRIWIKPTGGGEPRLFAASPRDVLSHVWSPDGGEIACLIPQGVDGETLLQAFPVAGGAPTMSVRLKRGRRLVSWISSRIYIESNDGLVAFFPDTEQTEELLRSETELGPRRNFDVRRDEKRAAYQLNAAIWVSDLDGSDARQVVPAGDLASRPRWWGPDGRRLVYASDRGGQRDLWSVKAAGGKPQQITRSSGDEYPENVSRDGRTLTFQEVVNDSNLWLMNPTTRESWQLTEDTLQDFWPSVSRNGLLAFHRRRPSMEMRSGVVEAEILLTRLESTELRQSRQAVDLGWDATLSPDGAYLAYARSSRNGPYELRIKELGTGHSWSVTESFEPSPIFVFPLDRARRNLAWSADGRSLFFVARGDGAQEIRRAWPAGSQNDTDLVVSFPTSSRLGDLAVSDDGAKLSYVSIHIPDWETVVHLHDLDSSADRALGRWVGKMVYSHGWLADDEALVAVVATADPRSFERLEVVLLDEAGSIRTLRVLDQAFGVTVRLDAERGSLYVTKTDGDRQVHNLYRLSLADGDLQRLTDNRIRGVTFSGLAVLDPGWIVYARHEENTSIWMIRTDG